jgi:CBS domain-containing protein
METDALQYISKMPHFSFLPKKEQERIAESAIYERHRAKTVYAKQGETRVENIFIVREGALALYDERENNKLVGHIKEGEVFGGITILLNGGLSLRTAKADKDCAGYAVPREIFLALTAHYPEFFEYFLENFSKHISDPSLDSLIEAGYLRRFLSGIEPFSFLPEEEIRRISDTMKVVRYPKNTVLFVQGSSRIGYLYILQKGSAERYYEEDGKRTMREFLSEGDLYGGISILLNDGISVRTVRTLEEAYFYMLPRRQFLDICGNYESFTEFFTDTFGKRMMERSYAAIVNKTMAPREDSVQFFNQHVASIYSMEPIFGTVTMSISEAAEKMTRNNISSLFINSEKGNCVGVVTERDLARRVIAQGLATSRPVSEIMTTPVRTIPEYAQVFDALMAMMENDIRHLAITDVDDNVVGILTNRDLLTAQGHSPLFLIRTITEASNIDEVVTEHNHLPQLIRTLVSSGAKADNLTHFITTVSDAILKKVMQFTLDQMGPPPEKFAFMIMGSEGRGEQTLKTDQDNAIVFEDVPEDRRKEVGDYFLKFGETANDLLNRAGYAFCEGNVMAKNPKLCQPLSVWKQRFSDWIHAAEAEDLLHASIFFDFRLGYGDGSLINRLRQHLFDSLRDWAGFFWHLSENALHFKPPLGFFRNFVVESKGEHRDKFDIKSAMTPIVDFARIYALRHKIEETNTLKRLSHLRLKDVISQKQYEELEKAYGFLMQLRLVRQVTAIIEERKKPDNYINPKSLTRIEQRMLKEIFARIDNFQKKLEVDFIGIM